MAEPINTPKVSQPGAAPSISTIKDEQAAKPLDTDPPVDPKAIYNLANLPEADRQVLLQQQKGYELFRDKLKELSENYKKETAEVGDRQAKVKLLALAGQLAAGFYGVKHGVDTSGLKFDLYDWTSEYNKLSENYKLGRQYQEAVYQATSSESDRLLRRISEAREAEARAKAQKGSDADRAEYKKVQLEQEKRRELDSFVKSQEISLDKINTNMEQALGNDKLWKQNVEGVASVSDFVDYETWRENKAKAGDYKTNWDDKDKRRSYADELKRFLSAKSKKSILDRQRLLGLDIYEDTGGQSTEEIPAKKTTPSNQVKVLIGNKEEMVDRDKFEKFKKDMAAQNILYKVLSE